MKASMAVKSDHCSLSTDKPLQVKVCPSLKIRKADKNKLKNHSMKSILSYGRYGQSLVPRRLDNGGSSVLQKLLL